MHHGIIFSIFNVEYPIDNLEPEKGLESNWELYASDKHGAVTQFGLPAKQWKIQSSRSAGSHKIASHLRDSGEWDVEVIDFWNAFSWQDLKALVDSRIHKDTVFVGFSMPFNGRYGKQINLNHYIKTNYPWVTTVAGGMMFNSISGTDADYHMIGRGEHGMDALCKYLTNSGSDLKFKKMTRNTHGHGLTSKQYKLIDCRYDYTAEPKRTVKVSYEERDYIESNETLTIELSRGCRFHCAFCEYYPLGVKGDWTRDVDDFESEMQENYDRWGVTNYLLTDETINDRTEKIEKFGAVVKSLPFKARFHGYMRADLLISRGQREIDACLEMGIMGHWYGVESLNHQSAKAIGKGMASDRVKEGLLMLDKHFEVNMSFILGLPHETIDSMRNTQKWLGENFSHRHVNMYPLYIDKPSHENRVDVSSKISLQGTYGWQTVFGENQWVHPQYGYTEGDMRKLQREWYDESYHGMPSIWSLPWVTSLGKDPDIVYGERNGAQHFSSSDQDIWDKKLAQYRINKLGA